MTQTEFEDFIPAPVVAAVRQTIADGAPWNMDDAEVVLDYTEDIVGTDAITDIGRQRVMDFIRKQLREVR